jgi:hypothetical protein
MALALTALTAAGAVVCAPAPAARDTGLSVRSAARHTAKTAPPSSVAAWAPAAAPNGVANDPEQRGVHIPDEPGTRRQSPERDSPDRGDSDGESPVRAAATMSSRAASVTSAEARPGLPATGGREVLLLLYFGSLCVIAGVAIRGAIAD